jgi:hypothetical protein
MHSVKMNSPDSPVCQLRGFLEGRRPRCNTQHTPARRLGLPPRGPSCARLKDHYTFNVFRILKA